MVEQEIINKILELNEDAKENVPKNKRFCYKEIKKEGRPFIGIAGLRGIGKTVMLKQFLQEIPNSLYMSLDSLNIPDLFEIIKYFNKERKIKNFFLDEVHYYSKWKQDLKKIYDFLNVNIFFTSSVAMDILSSKIDLTRRVIVKKMYPFNIREYLFFKKNKTIKKLSLKDIENDEKMIEIANYDFIFPEYIEGGLIPASLESAELEIFKGIAETVIEKDLPRIEKWNYEDIENVKNMLKFIASSSIEDISYSSISKNVGITIYKAKTYVEALEKSFILNKVEPTGTNVLKEPKILFMPPFRKVFSKEKTYDKGAQREEFFIMSMKMLNIPVFYLKTKRGKKMPDYLTEINGKKYVFEIGGKGKSLEQLKIPLKKSIIKKILTYPSTISEHKLPLTFFGFLV